MKTVVNATKTVIVIVDASPFEEGQVVEEAEEEGFPRCSRRRLLEVVLPILLYVVFVLPIRPGRPPIILPNKPILLYVVVVASIRPKSRITAHTKQIQHLGRIGSGQ